LAVVELNWKWGFLDTENTEAIPMIYDWANSFTEGLAAVKLDEKYGFIDKNGQEAIPFKYDYIYDSFREGIAEVKLNEKRYYIDKRGHEYETEEAALIAVSRFNIIKNRKKNIDNNSINTNINIDENGKKE
jgi:hypothetical protein